jgi:phosphohistidine phosphatase
MRRVTLLRHGQAEERHPSGRDFERRLTPAGRAEATASARELLRLDALPQLILASPAQRTQETARLVLRELAAAAATPLFELEPRIYNAALHELLAVLRGAPAAVQHVLLVGHNPGISEAARLLSGEEAAALATAQFVSVVVDIPRWDALSRS